MSEDIRKNFASDNVTPVCPEVMEAINSINHGSVPSYGEDILSHALNDRFSEVFETEVAVFPIVTGTAANSLALSSIVAPYGSVLCDQSAHINTDEGGAPEFFMHGAKLVGIPSPQGQMDPQILPDLIKKNSQKGTLAPPFQCLSLTQATEWGTTYTCDTINQLSKIAHDHTLAVHLDGARLGNAIAHLNCTPAETTWKAGVDILSFGGTKAGAMAAEAIVFFINDRTRPMLKAVPHLRKRSGHTWSKQRFLSAQLLALLDNDLWLKNARHANIMSQRLLHALQRHPGVHVPFTVESNEVFAVLPDPLLQSLHEEGFQFYYYPTPDGVSGQLARFVTSFYTRSYDIDAIIQHLTA